jgi:hypothetical protein
MRFLAMSCSGQVATNEWNELDLKVREAEKVNGIESTSRWFRTS